MVTAEELTVAIRSEGVGETRQDLEGVESAMQDTAESAGDSAAQLEGFSERFAGAMSAAVAALTIGAAGLLSQVPVLGETFAGLGAIVSALAFQMDSVLRPALSPLTDVFFNIANAIFELDGFVGDLVGGLTAFISIATVVIGTVAAVAAQIWGWATVLSTAGSILGTLAGAVVTVAGAIASLPAVIVAAVAAIIAFAAAYALNIGGVRDKTNSVLSDIWTFFTNLASDLSEWASGLSADFLEWGDKAIGNFLKSVKDAGAGVLQWFIDLGVDLLRWSLNLADQAEEWGRSIIQGIIDGIRSSIGTLKEQLNELRELGPDVNISIPDIGGGGGGGTVTGRSTSSGSGRRSFGGTGTSFGSSQIDGRQLSESTGRYRSDPNRRRGL